MFDFEGTVTHRNRMGNRSRIRITGEIPQEDGEVLAEFTLDNLGADYEIVKSLQLGDTVKVSGVWMANAQTHRCPSCTCGIPGKVLVVGSVERA